MPPQRSKFYKPSLFVLLFSFILVVFEVAFLFTFYRNLSQKTAATEEYRSDLNNQIILLQKEVLKLKTDIKIKPKEPPRDVILLLKQDNKKIVQILEIFSKRLPQKAWISHLSQKENQFLIDGFALNNGIISDFLLSLQKSDQFSEVKLIKAEQLDEKRGALKKFAIACFTPPL